MPNIRLSHFRCPGAGPDTPQEGFEVLESDVEFFKPGDFLLSLEELGEDVIPIVQEESAEERVD